MKLNKPFLVLILVTFILSASFVSAQSSQELTLESGAASHKGLDEVYRRFSEGYRKLDASAVANLYTADAFYLSPGSDVRRGREKILGEFSSFFDSVKKAGGSLTISFQILGRQISGDLAYDVGIYTLSQKSSKGETRSSRGKFVVVARRLNDGEWLFQVDGYSNLPNTSSNNQKQQSQNTKKEKPNGETGVIFYDVFDVYKKVSGENR